MNTRLNEELFESTRRILAGSCGVTVEITRESHLFDDLALDSMGLLALAIGLENEHKIRLEEDPSAPPQTVEEVLNLLESRLAEHSKNREVK